MGSQTPCAVLFGVLGDTSMLSGGVQDYCALEGIQSRSLGRWRPSVFVPQIFMILSPFVVAAWLPLSGPTLCAVSAYCQPSALPPREERQPAGLRDSPDMAVAIIGLFWWFSS